MQKIKISRTKWRKILKSALLTTFVLAAIAVCYGYYLVEKISESYGLAQEARSALVSTTAADVMPDKTAHAISEETDTLREESTHLPSKEARTAVTSQAADTPEEGNIRQEKTAENIAEKSENSEQGQVQIIRYETVGASGYTDLTPCTLSAVYEYGYGYDPLYKDIRFHDHAFYRADESFAVTAVADGTVEDIATDGDKKTIILRHAWGLSEYGGVENCRLEKGEKVQAGEDIADASELYYKLWAEK